MLSGGEGEDWRRRRGRERKERNNGGAKEEEEGGGGGAGGEEEKMEEERRRDGKRKGGGGGGRGGPPNDVIRTESSELSNLTNIFQMGWNHQLVKCPKSNFGRGFPVSSLVFSGGLLGLVIKMTPVWTYPEMPQWEAAGKSSSSKVLILFDGRNVANQLRLVVYPIIFLKVSYMPGVAGLLPSTVWQILGSQKLAPKVHPATWKTVILLGTSIFWGPHFDLQPWGRFTRQSKSLGRSTPTHSPNFCESWGAKNAAFALNILRDPHILSYEIHHTSSWIERVA